MSGVAEAPARRGPGRPRSDAPDRILAAAYEVLKRDGYAGLTTAKVAAASGQNKALIAYHFGSKQGLVAAVARRVSEAITEEVLAGVGEPSTARELVHGLADGVWRALDRDEGLQRVYFDLASQSVVEQRVGEIMREMKEGHRAVLRELLRGLADGPSERDLDADHRLSGRRARGALARAPRSRRDRRAEASARALRRIGEHGRRRRLEEATTARLGSLAC